MALLGPINGVVSTILVGGDLTSLEAGWLLLAYGIIISVLGGLSFGAAHHRLDGAAIWLLIFVMGLLVTGVGFYVASLLAVVGGVHIYTWKPRTVGGPELIRQARRPS